MGDELDAGQSQLVGPQRDDAPAQFGDVLGLARRRLPPCEGQQVADDSRGALRLLRDAAEVASEILPRLHVGGAGPVAHFL